MSVLINKALLLLLILPSIAKDSISDSAIEALIIILILTSLCSYLEGKGAIAAVAAECLFCLWAPGIPFLSLVIYDCFSVKNTWFRYCALVPLLASVTRQTPASFFSCLGLCFLSVVLAIRTGQQEQILAEYHQVRDDATENSLLLERQNRELQKNQNYEVELATLTERNRIAREIHDNVGHLLTRSILQVSALLVIHDKEPELKEQLTQVKATLTDAMNNVRNSVHNLHEDAMVLKQQVTSLIDAFTFCPVSLSFDCGPLPKEINYAAMAVIKEALSNVARHSNADKVSISVLEHPSLYQIIIQDNGSSAKDTNSGGIGLVSMEERIRALGGVFCITRTNGFKIFISIPKGGFKT